MDSESGAASLPHKPSWIHWLLLTSLVLLVAAIVLPPLFNISRYKRRIATSISSSIGRPVHMSTVRLHLLPLPGFEISGFEVEEDPAFGDEPMLRSPRVVTSIRLSSLWRGRLEMARIHFEEPSLNLVHDGQGRWNFDSVLLKASQSEIAPTVQSRPGAALRFPYIVGTSARINFKQGYEKKPLSFLNADVSIWLDQPEQWRLRFEAQPARTDLDLAISDTGLVRIDGTFHSASDLQKIPIVLHAEWIRIPLGQLTRLLADRDMGWRGDLDVRADITGTAANTRIKARIRANGVHRLEFAPLDPLDMDTTCQGSYLDATSSLEDLTCRSPIGNGELLLAGAIHALSSEPQPDVKLHMEKVPASAVLASIRSVRSDFAPNLRARGTLDGDFRFGPQNGSVSAVLNGSATVNALELTSPDLEKPLLIPQLRLTTIDGKPVEQPHPARHSRNKVDTPRPTSLGEQALLLRAFTLAGPGPSPLMADGRFTATRFAVHMDGEATVRKLTAIGKNFGLLSSALAPLTSLGTAAINLTIRGPWLLPVPDIDHPLTVDTAEGTLELRNARIAPDFLPAPVDLISASATFSGDQMAWRLSAFNYAGLSGEGALRYRIPCRGEKGCDAQFALRFPALDATHAEAALLGGSEREVTLKEMLARLDGRARPWPRLSGTIEADTFTLSELTVHDLRASLAIDGNHVQMSSLDGRTLGGTLHVSGALDATGSRPHYAADADLSKANAAEIASLFHEKWGSGVISLATHFDMTGYTASEFASSATGTYRWDWAHGSLLAEPGLALSRFDRWQAEGRVTEKLLTLDHSSLTPGGQPMAVTGSISFDRALKLGLGDDTSTTLLTGTPQKPHVEQTASVEAIKRSTRTSP